MPIIETPIQAGRLPPEIRGDMPPETLVRVSLEVLRDENGFTPEEAVELRRAIEEADRGENVFGPFSNAEAMIAHLRAQCDRDAA